METNQTVPNDQVAQDLDRQINDLVDEAKKINQEIDAVGEKAKKEMDVIESEVDESIMKVEKIYSDLDQIEKEAGDEFDKLMLEESEDLAGE
ncbi:MAG: hypothetical protein WC120_01180 [Parcubacteria group bacterium]